jgi:hypothetical protein
VREEHRLRLFENRVLRKIFEPMRDETTKEWRRLHNEKLCDLYSSSIIVRMIISRVIRFAGYVTRMEEKTGAYRFWWSNPREILHLKDPDVDRR